VTAGTPQVAAGGVPRVFGVVATASPVPTPGTLRSIERATEVALRTAPVPGQTFPIRAPRGLFVPGMLFVLTCDDAYGPRRALVRVLTVSDTTGVNFQLVTGRLVQAAQRRRGPEQPAPVPQPITAQIIDGEVEGGRLSASLLEVSDTAVTFTATTELRADTMLQVIDAARPGLCGAVLRVARGHREGSSNVYAATFEHAWRGRSSLDSPPAGSRRTVAGTAGPSSRTADGGAGIALAATAMGVTVDGIPTIAAETSVTIRSAVELGVPLELTAPRGAIPEGACFVLRFYNGDGAKRSLVRATGVRPLPGMTDAVDGVLLRAAMPAPEGASYRVRIDRFFVAEVVTEGSRQVTGRLLDLSAGGVGLLLGGAKVGDRLRFSTPGSSLPGLDGAEVVLVRRDPRDPQRFGGRFLEDGRGKRALATILDADRAERERLREAKREAARRSREFAEATMLESLGTTADGGVVEPAAEGGADR